MSGAAAVGGGGSGGAAAAPASSQQVTPSSGGAAVGSEKATKELRWAVRPKEATLTQQTLTSQTKLTAFRI
jgi:hypothetical protein